MRMLGNRIWWRVIDPSDHAPKSCTQEFKQQWKRREKQQWQRELPDEIYDRELWEFFYHDYSDYFLRGTELEPDLWLYRLYQERLHAVDMEDCYGDPWPTGVTVDGNMVMWSKG